MAIDDLTRKDIEQLFENQTAFISQGFDDMDQRMDRFERSISDQIAELRTTVDRNDRLDSEDIQTIYREIALIKKHVGLEITKSAVHG